MTVARRQVLVQLSDSLLALLDERAGRAGVSRSELIRRSLDAYLATGRSAAIDRAIVEGYTRIPPAPEDAWADAALDESLHAEPW